jgi:hypothetical protein
MKIIFIGILFIILTFMFSIHLTLPMVLIAMVIGALIMLVGLIDELRRK